MELFLAQQYLAGRIPLNGPVFQLLLNTYVYLYNRLGSLWEHSEKAFDKQEMPIAHRSDELMNIHYNLPEALFTSFLGRTMKYSMALWEGGAESLDAAQDAMLDDLCDKAGLEDGQTILDVGCGFGSFAAHALRRYPNVRVYGLTLSQTQVAYMRRKMQEPGHPLNTDRFNLRQGDFNEVRYDVQFDRIVSIGVFEHVSNFPPALEKLRAFLSDDGKVLLHYIIYRKPLDRMPEHSEPDNFMRRYIFPGGRFVFEDEIFSYQQHLRVMRHWILNGMNYRRTLECWLDAFKRNEVAIRKACGWGDQEVRMWELYLRVCIAVFNAAGGRYYGNGQYLLEPA